MLRLTHCLGKLKKGGVHVLPVTDVRYHRDTLTNSMTNVFMISKLLLDICENVYK